MPFKLAIIKGKFKNKYTCVNIKTKQIFSQGSSKANAIKQLRVLRMAQSREKLNN
jgi:hypothetical protein